MVLGLRGPHHALQLQLSVIQEGAHEVQVMVGGLQFLRCLILENFTLWAS